MDLRQLRYFVAIAEHGNFHRAAEAVNVAQSALSRHMQILGQELGSPLFERAPGGVSTTSLGKVFYVEAKGILERADYAIDRSRKAVNGQVGRLNIGVNEIVARHPLFAAAIAKSRQFYPEVELAVERFNSPEQVEALWAGKLDIGIVIDRPPHPDFAWMHFLHDPFLIGMSPDHRLAAKSVLLPSDLVSENFITMRSTRYGPAQGQILAECRKLGFNPSVVQEAANEQMQLALIGTGLGVGLVTKSALLVCPQQLIVRPLQGLSHALELDLLWLRRNASPPLTHLLEVFSSVWAEPQILPRARNDSAAVVNQ